tara:strand:+ start:176 stop:685 length:510 start_codon:yes stop_codon:yes gene_type:complete
MNNIFRISFLVVLSLTLIVSSCTKDGSPAVFGCTDSTAYNFNQNANEDDNSCVYAHQIMVNTWNISSECNGSLLNSFLPETIEILAGATMGDLLIDLGGLFGSLNGTISHSGIIDIPSQDFTIDLGLPVASLVTIHGSGTLDSVSNCTIQITATAAIFGSEDCTLTMTL